jgi:nucleotide-binding universal stress UspA family protein
MAMKHILVPTDGSEPSYRALALAAQLAESLGVELSILAVRQAVVEVWEEDELSDILKKSKEIADALYRKGAAIAEMRARDVAHAILGYAEQNAVDLIVMGASGKGSVKAFLIGSVSKEVLRKSICPVTIVH